MTLTNHSQSGTVRPCSTGPTALSKAAAAHGLIRRLNIGIREPRHLKPPLPSLVAKLGHRAAGMQAVAAKLLNGRDLATCLIMFAGCRMRFLKISCALLWLSSGCCLAGLQHTVLCLCSHMTGVCPARRLCHWGQTFALSLQSRPFLSSLVGSTEVRTWFRHLPLLRCTW